MSSNNTKLIKALLCLSDSILSIIFFAPLVIGYWRGCWQIMDLILFPDNELHSLLASLCIGILCELLFGLVQNILTKLSSKKNCTTVFVILSRIYTVIYCICSVNHWRGVWMSWDFLTGTSWQSGLISAFLGIFMLGLTRGIKNILAPPFILIPDYRECYFLIHTQFKTTKDHGVYFFLDLFFTVVVTGSLVVFVWRGSWIFLDGMLLPDNPTYSAFGSLTIGLGTTSVAFIFQLGMISCLKDIPKGIYKIFIEDLYNIICFIGAVNMWRGVWNLLNIYFFPEYPILSNTLTMISGNFILVLLFCANGTIPTRGAGIDGEHEGALGVIFHTNYLRSLCTQKKQGNFRRRNSCRYEAGSLTDPMDHEQDLKRNGMITCLRRNLDSSSSSDDEQGNFTRNAQEMESNL